MASDTCHGNGNCNSNGFCECNAGYDVASNCSICVVGRDLATSCTSCAADYYGFPNCKCMPFFFSSSFIRFTFISQIALQNQIAVHMEAVITLHNVNVMKDSLLITAVFVRLITIHTHLAHVCFSSYVFFKKILILLKTAPTREHVMEMELATVQDVVNVILVLICQIVVLVQEKALFIQLVSV